jgi:hypothetical protein
MPRGGAFAISDLPRDRLCQIACKRRGGYTVSDLPRDGLCQIPASAVAVLTHTGGRRWTPGSATWLCPMCWLRFSFTNSGGYEYPLVWLIIFISIAVRCAGRYSIAKRFGKEFWSDLQSFCRSSADLRQVQQRASSLIFVCPYFFELGYALQVLLGIDRHTKSFAEGSTFHPDLCWHSLSCGITVSGTERRQDVNGKHYHHEDAYPERGEKAVEEPINEGSRDRLSVHHGFAPEAGYSAAQ